MGWQTISCAPFRCDLQPAVIDTDGVHALVFPCRRILRGWVGAQSGEHVYVRPSHWRDWRDTIKRFLLSPLSLKSVADVSLLFLPRGTALHDNILRQARPQSGLTTSAQTNALFG